MKVTFNIGNCALGSYCLVVTHANHSGEFRMPNCHVQLPKQPLLIRYRLRWLSSLVVSNDLLSLLDYTFLTSIMITKTMALKKKENEVGRIFPRDFAPRISLIQVFRWWRVERKRLRRKKRIFPPPSSIAVSSC